MNNERFENLNVNCKVNVTFAETQMQITKAGDLF